MKRILLAYLLMGSCMMLRAQMRCGTQLSPEMDAYIHSQTQLLSNAKITAGTITYIPLRITIIRQSDGTSPLTEEQILNGLAKVNRYFAGSNLQFYMAGDFKYIDNSAYYDFNNNMESEVCPNNDISNAANVYLANTVTSSGILTDGYTYYPGAYTASKRMFISYAGVNNDRTWSHHMGHFFNLLHTYYNSAHPIISERELVTRTTGANCATKGDLLCDTPADPYEITSGYPDSYSCRLISGDTDANGDSFDPRIQNIMSSYDAACGYEFSYQQMQRMRSASFDASRSSLTYAGSSNVPSNLMGYPEIDAIKLVWTDNSLDETGFFIERSLSPSSDFKVVGYALRNVTSFTDLDPELNSYTTYYYRIRQANSTKYSNITTIKSITTDCKPQVIDTNQNVYIDNFALTANTSISNTGSGRSPNSYGDFRYMSADVTAGTTISFSYAVPGPDYISQQLAVFADFNHDGDFNDPTETLFQSQSSAVTFNPSITIPSSALNGPATLRIRCNLGSLPGGFNACEKLMYGETEDYTINISGGTIAPEPLIITQYPADNSINIPVTDKLSLKFNQNVVPGPGFITIRKVIDNSVVESIPAYSPQVVFQTDSSVIISPSFNLEGQTEFTISLDSAFAYHMDYGNSPIKDPTSWTFITEKASSIAESLLGKNVYKIYPNPTAGEVKLKYPALPGETKLRILTLQGMVLDELLISDPDSLLHFDKYPKGMFILEFIYDGVPVQFEKILYR